MGSRASQGWSRAFWVEPGYTGGARFHPKPPAGSTPKFGSAPRLPAGVEPGSPTRGSPAPPGLPPIYPGGLLSVSCVTHYSFVRSFVPPIGEPRLPTLSPTLGSRGARPGPCEWYPGAQLASSPLGGAEERSPRRWRHQQPSHVSHSRQRTIRLGRPRGAGNPQWSRAARQARCAPAQTTVTLLVMIVPLAHPLLASAEAGTFLEAALPCRSRPVLRALLPLTSSRRRPSSP